MNIKIWLVGNACIKASNEARKKDETKKERMKEK